jgi:hypothetical protein
MDSCIGRWREKVGTEWPEAAAEALFCHSLSILANKRIPLQFPLLFFGGGDGSCGDGYTCPAAYIVSKMINQNLNSRNNNNLPVSSLFSELVGGESF